MASLKQQLADTHELRNIPKDVRLAQVFSTVPTSPPLDDHHNSLVGSVISMLRTFFPIKEPICQTSPPLESS